MSEHLPPTATCEVAVVGAGIVGLGAALAAVDRGFSVIVIDRSASIAGASIRNFGHLCFSAQSGAAREYALTAREIWLRLAREAGFWIDDTGTFVAARHQDELELLREFAADRDGRPPEHGLNAPAEVELLSPLEIERRAGLPFGSTLGGALLPDDLHVNPREAATSIREYLASRGVEFRMRTNVAKVTSGRVETSRGLINAGLVVVAVNHDIDQLYPALAQRHGVVRCGLDMLRVRSDLATPLRGPLLTGWSLIRYSAFTKMPSAVAVRERLHRERPDLAALDLNQMYTPLPDGSVIVGDSHWNGEAVDPFQPEAASRAFLAAFTELFGASADVIERWQGIYATAPEEFLIDESEPGVLVTIVTTGIGMTTGLGLAEHVVGGQLDRSSIPLKEGTIQ